jgi:hypothetical protein
LDERNLAAFDSFIREKCQALLEEIDNWLSKFDPPDPKKGDKVLQTGVGIYHFVVDEQDQVRKIKDLLEDRSVKDRRD